MTILRSKLRPYGRIAVHMILLSQSVCTFGYEGQVGQALFHVAPALYDVLSSLCHTQQAVEATCFKYKLEA